MNILVTGATDGLGRALAGALCERGHRVLVHGRNPAKLAETAEQVGAEDKLLADFASLADVRRLADGLPVDTLDVLVNNAGIGFGPPGAGREVSRDGYELRFAVNYLAGYLLTRLLLPRTGRVVNVASAGQYPIDFDDVQLERSYDGTRAYRQAKLAQIMFTFDLAEEGVTANALHPATFMPTRMVRESGIAPVSSLDAGLAATLRLVLDDVGTGRYFDGIREGRAHPQAYDAGARARLRDYTENLLTVR